MSSRNRASYSQFEQAVREGNENHAVYLIDRGLVKVDACVGNLPALTSIDLSFDVPTGLVSFAETPILFYAIYYQREKVIRKLVEFAEFESTEEDGQIDLLNKFVRQGFVGRFNAAGIATFFSRPTMLALVHELGASLSKAFIPTRSEDGKPTPAFMAAMSFAEPGCVDFILEVMYPGKQIGVSPVLVRGIAAFARLGISAGQYRGNGLDPLHVCQVLLTKGFDFRMLYSVQPSPYIWGYPVNVHWWWQHVADQLFSSAEASGDKDLVRFLVEEAGLKHSKYNRRTTA